MPGRRMLFLLLAALVLCAACSDPTKPGIPDITGGRIEVTVTGGSTPFAGILVGIEPVGLTADTPRMGRTDAFGTIVFADVASGSWNVIVTPPATHDFATPEREKRVQVREDAPTLVTVALLPLPNEARGELIVGAAGLVVLPCGSGEEWLVKQDSLARAAFHSVHRAGARQVYVEFPGTPSPLGSYGGFGNFDREITPAGTVEVRAMRAADCAQPGLNVAPQGVTLGIGESALIDMHWMPIAGSLPGALQWSSDNASVATVDAAGSVSAAGIGTAIISVSNVADTARVVVRVAPQWYLEGYATLDGVLTNEDGSPFAAGIVTIHCPLAIPPQRTDASGRFSASAYYPESGAYIQTAAAMSNGRGMPCRAHAERQDGVTGIGFVTLRFGTLAADAAASHLSLSLKPRPPALSVQPENLTLSVGHWRTLQIFELGINTEDVDLRSLDPDVAAVRPGLRTEGVARGATIVIASARGDTTAIGFANVVITGGATARQ